LAGVASTSAGGSDWSWIDVAKRLRVALGDERSSLAAAGAAFYAFLSLVPGLAASVSVYGLLADPDDVSSHVRRAFAVLPDDAQQLLVSQLSRIVDKSSGTLGVSFAVSVVVALWSASRGAAHLLDAIGVAYGQPRRGFALRRAAALGCTVVGMVVGIAAVTAFAVLPDHVPAGAARWLVHLALWIAVTLVGLAGLAALYRLGAGGGATGEEPRWTLVAPGSVAALTLLVLVTVALDVYASHFGSYDATYGALAGVVLLMLWLHLVARIVIVGAQINADLDAALDARPTDP
jgi:membrane protein